MASTSCELQSHLPEDILADILRRLPLRTLARFRCVSKSWRSLFADPFFVRTHLNFLKLHPHLNTRIILSRYIHPPLSVGPEDYSSLPTAEDDSKCGFEISQELHLPPILGNIYSVKGHCDGLICVIISDGSIVLWNPSIREYRKLPTPSNFRKTREVLGLGFDPSLNDYKIVRAPSDYCNCKIKDYHPQIEVFTLGSNSWRKLPDEETPPFFIQHYQQSLTLNGGLYWLTMEDFRTIILRFDLVEEKFKVVPPPPQDGPGRNIAWLGVLNDSLCVFHSQRFTYIDIWTTMDDQTWTKLITIPKIHEPEPSLRCLDYSPLCFMKSGTLLMRVRGKGLVAYDPVDDRYSKLAVLESESWLHETVCTESLVSPYGCNRALEQTGSSSTITLNLWKLLLDLKNGVSQLLAMERPARLLPALAMYKHLRNCITCKNLN
ncbi:putative F-box protein [Senna tora]|uniref:Putative F-box protein n=1 Tax=Senna tora TaxID=362788 RepID=A0A834TZC7_9FABA|nr:putative F-box protein [Senna tora]